MGRRPRRMSRLANRPLPDATAPSVNLWKPERRRMRRLIQPDLAAARQSEGEPAAARVHQRNPEHVVQDRPVRIRVCAVGQNVRA